MHPSTFLTTALFLTLASALPLNINLGAYSPAVVVGDGAIEFEGGEAAEGKASKSAPSAQQPEPQPPNKRLNTRRLLQPRIPYHPLLSRHAPAPNPLDSRSPDDEDIVLPTVTLPVPVPPDPPEEPLDPDPDASTKTKRASQPTKRQDGDGLAGFDRALQFAEVALTKGPDIQLGTGAHGAGVGVIVDNNQGSESVVGPFPTGGGQPAPAPAGGGGGQVPPAGGGGLVPPLAPGGGQVAEGGQGVVVVGRPPS